MSFDVGRASFEFGGAPILFALVLEGPARALVAALPSAAYRDPSRVAFQGAVHVAQVLAGSVVFSFLSPAPPVALLTTSSATKPMSLASLCIATVDAGLVFFGLDSFVGPMLMRLKYGMLWRQVFVEFILPAVPSEALAVATVLVAVPVASFSAPSASVVLMGGAFLTSLAVARVREHRKRSLRLEAENAALRDGLRNSNAEFASRLVGRLPRRVLRGPLRRLCRLRTRHRKRDGPRRESPVRCGWPPCSWTWGCCEFSTESS